MFQKSLAAIALTVLAATAAHAEPALAKKSDTVIEVKEKTAKILSELFEGKDMKGSFKGLSATFDKIFNDKIFSGKADDGDEDEDDDDDSASTSGPCISTADGKPGSSNNEPGSSNGGAGGTVELKGKQAPGDCYSANGGDGGSNNYSWGKDNIVGGNGGKGGKIISR